MNAYIIIGALLALGLAYGRLARLERVLEATTIRLARVELRLGLELEAMTFDVADEALEYLRKKDENA